MIAAPAVPPCDTCGGWCTNQAECSINQITRTPHDWRAAPLAGTVYHGIPNTSGTGACTVLVERDGVVTGTVAHIVKHSPTGMAWGYAGSGAADCAQSVLAAALGPLAACPECDGTQLTVFDPEIPRPDGMGDFRAYQPGTDPPADVLDPELTGKCWCEGGFRKLPYQRFKFAFIAGFPADGEWTMRREDIVRWFLDQPDTEEN